MDREKDRMERVVVFSILMENNDGILGKAPSYIAEKINTVTQTPDPSRLLDPINLAKFETWKKRWHS